MALKLGVQTQADCVVGPSVDLQNFLRDTSVLSDVFNQQFDTKRKKGFEKKNPQN